MPGCPQCGKAVAAQTPERIVERILADHDGAKAILLAPIVRDRKGEYRKELNALLRDGFVRARIDGEVVELKADMRLHRYKRHTIEAVMDRLVVKEGVRGRLAEGVERALDKGAGFMNLLLDDTVVSFSRFLHCVACGVDLPELEPRLFSFNSPRGACPDCLGLGERRAIDPRKVVADPEKSISDGALAVMTRTKYLTYTSVRVEELASLVPVDVPWKDLSEEQRQLVLHGAAGATVDRARSWSGKHGEVSMRDRVRYKGIVPALEEAWKERKSKGAERFVGEMRCPTCEGRRLQPVALAVKFRGRSLDVIAGMTVDEADAFFAGVELEGSEELVGREILKELRSFSNPTPASRGSCARASGSCPRSASAISPSTARRRRSPAARPSASASPRRWARASRASPTCWTSRASACTRGTTGSS